MAGEYDWDASWSATSIANATTANGSSETTASISNDGKLGTEVSVTVQYNATTANQGVDIYILRDVDGTNNEDESDDPYAFRMPYAVGATRRRTIFVPPSVSSFKVRVVNDSGASLQDLDVRTRQAVAAA